MKQLQVNERVTLDGRTYQPGTYQPIPDNREALVNEVNQAQADKLLRNHPDMVAWVADKPKPAPQVEGKKADEKKPARKPNR